MRSSCNQSMPPLAYSNKMRSECGTWCVRAWHMEMLARFHTPLCSTPPCAIPQGVDDVGVLVCCECMSPVCCIAAHDYCLGPHFIRLISRGRTICINNPKKGRLIDHKMV